MPSPQTAPGSQRQGPVTTQSNPYAGTTGVNTPTPAPLVQVDLLVPYTPEVALAVPNLPSYIQLAVDMANEAMALARRRG